MRQHKFAPEWNLGSFLHSHYIYLLEEKKTKKAKRKTAKWWKEEKKYIFFQKKTFIFFPSSSGITFFIHFWVTFKSFDIDIRCRIILDIHFIVTTLGNFLLVFAAEIETNFSSGVFDFNILFKYRPNASSLHHVFEQWDEVFFSL